MVTRKKKSKIAAVLGSCLHFLVVVVGAVALTLAFFLVLPVIQTISAARDDDLVIQQVQTAELEPPPPTPEEEPEPEPEQEEPPPRLDDEAPPLELSQIELQLNPGASGGVGSIGSASIIQTAVAVQAESEIASFEELDQRPRVVYQPGPVLTAKARKRTPGKVYVIFIVNEQGKVENAMVQRASDPIFKQPALAAVKRWRFEPGKRSGKPVRFRMRVPITFPEGT